MNYTYFKELEAYFESLPKDEETDKLLRYLRETQKTFLVLKREKEEKHK